MRTRSDLSNWLIHFIHRRNPENDPLVWDEDPEVYPVIYNKYGEGMHNHWFEMDERSHLEPDAYAFSILLKILDDGHIRAGWSFRNFKKTIYGHRAAVCFTEMPLYAFLGYVLSRRDESSVDNYAIALLKDEIFQYGGRPVIYGLSSTHIEAEEGDPNHIPNCRTLAESCGISLNEQYRYVSMNIGGSRLIDWSHEREWRWTKDFGPEFDIPGIPLWLDEADFRFSKILVLLSTIDEEERFLKRMKEYYDAGYNDIDTHYSKDSFLNTRVLSIESLRRTVPDLSRIRLEEIPFRSLKKIEPIKVSREVKRRVERAMIAAQKAAENAAMENIEKLPRDSNGVPLPYYFGFANVVTYESNTEVTQALIDLKYAEPIGGVGYWLFEATERAETRSSLDAEEAAAQAAADVLEEILGQPFYVTSRPD